MHSRKSVWNLGGTHSYCSFWFVMSYPCHNRGCVWYTGRFLSADFCLPVDYSIDKKNGKRLLWATLLCKILFKHISLCINVILSMCRVTSVYLTYHQKKFNVITHVIITGSAQTADVVRLIASAHYLRVITYWKGGNLGGSTAISLGMPLLTCAQSRDDVMVLLT